MSVSDGLELFNSGNIVESIGVLEKALKNEPNNINGIYTLGIGYFRMKEFDKAKNSFEKVITLDHCHHLAHYYLGLVYERKGKRDDAILEYKIAEIINPNFVEAKKKLNLMEATNPMQDSQGEASFAPQRQANNSTTLLLDEEVGALVIDGKRRRRSFSFWFILGILTLPVLGSGLLILLIIDICGQTTKYTIFERRIDIAYGIFLRRYNSIWLYQIEDIWLERSLFNWFTGDATIYLQVTGLEGTGFTRVEITGLGGSKKMQSIWQTLRDRALKERIEKKKFLV